MKRSDLTEKLLDIKRDNGWIWKYICEKIAGYSEVLIVGAVLGQMKLTKPQATKRRRTVRSVQVRDRHAQRNPDARYTDAANGSLDLPFLRTGDGQRLGLEGG